MATILFILGFAAAVGVAVWTSRRTTGTGPSRSNHYLSGSSGTVVGDYDSRHHHHHHGGGGDGGGWSGGGGDGGGGGN